MKPYLARLSRSKLVRISGVSFLLYVIFFLILTYIFLFLFYVCLYVYDFLLDFILFLYYSTFFPIHFLNFHFLCMYMIFFLYLIFFLSQSTIFPILICISFFCLFVCLFYLSVCVYACLSFLFYNPTFTDFPSLCLPASLSPSVRFSPRLSQTSSTHQKPKTKKKKLIPAQKSETSYIGHTQQLNMVCSNRRLLYSASVFYSLYTP